MMLFFFYVWLKIKLIIRLYQQRSFYLFQDNRTRTSFLQMNDSTNNDRNIIEESIGLF